MKFGTTPWGERFINALHRIGDSGRLSRGKTYANGGNVAKLELFGTDISAKVRGSQRTPYSISIKFKPFSAADQKIIFKTIEENPLILADIMNRQLPDSLCDILAEQKIHLLPRSFSEMTRSCSCPDWGDPCKHMASVYYILTAEIDKNPFTIFEIRGIDLLGHFKISEETLAIELPISLNWNDQPHPEPSADTPFEMVRLKPSSGFILSMLSDNPPFGEVNYRVAFEEFYKSATKKLPLKFIPHRTERSEELERILQSAEYSIEFDETISSPAVKITSPLFSAKNDMLNLFSHPDCFPIENGVELRGIAIAQIFLGFSSPQGSAEYRFLFNLSRVLYLLTESCGFVPAVLPQGNKPLIIYKPLACVPEIEMQLKELAVIASAIVHQKKKWLSPESTVSYLLSSFLTYAVHEMEFMHKAQKNNPPQISHGFFNGESIYTGSFETKTTPQSMAGWLSVFDLVKTGRKFQLTIDHNDLYEISMSFSEDSKTVPLHRAVKGKESLTILKFLSFLKLYLPEVQDLIQDPVIELSSRRLEEFVLSTASSLAAIGVNVILPKELKNLLVPRPIIKAKGSAKSLTSFLSLNKLLEYQWNIAIGDTIISVAEFQKLVASGSELIEFNNQFVRVSAEEAKRIFADLSKREELSAFDLIQANLKNELIVDESTKFHLDSLTQALPYPVPTNLNATLRPYQIRGFQWAVNNLKNGFGTILADDMGLGKTIQTIATILQMKDLGLISDTVLIVAPMTLLTNWGAELNRFAPSLKWSIYHGSAREFSEHSDIVITTYSLVARDELIFSKQKISCLIIDEAQAIKNPDTKTTKAVKKIKADFRIALSGTPVENNLSEFWSIFDFAIPKYLKTLSHFKNEFAKDIEIRKDHDKIAQLKMITAPFMLRRLKTDKTIISDLPDKIVIDEYAVHSVKQASLYQSLVETSLKELDSLEGIERKGMIFKLIIGLKQICNHPRNYDASHPSDAELSGKAELLLTLLESMLERREKVLVFSQYTEMIAILQEIIEQKLHTVPLTLTGSMSREKREEAVNLFQNSDRYPIFILSLKAAGTGLNLTAASNVVHYDLWFNPAVENQATDRAFRIGQKKNVFVHRLITRNSFEEKINSMIQVKQELSDLSVSTGETWISELSNDEIRGLFL